MTLALRDYQGREGALGAVEAALRAGCRRQLVSLPTGCHRRGQGILRFDGTIVPVEEVRVGDLLMGPDSRPRAVLAVARGEEEMVEVRPTKGSPWVVNGSHILTLIRTREAAVPVYPSEARAGEIVDVPVSEWETWTKWRKHVHKLFRVGVDFLPAGRLPFNPYWLGLMLGDGTLARPGVASITTVDPEVIREVDRIAEAFGLRVRKERITYHFAGVKKKRNPLASALRSLGLSGIACRDRFVPGAFKTASRADRLELLAGLLDTDGSLSCGGYEFGSMSRHLAADVAFVARSLGLAAYIAHGQAGGYRVTISGDCSVIPCRIPRKQASKRRQKKDALRVGFTVRRLGAVEPYFGFALDGDGRYLLDDFTVTHNTGKTCVFANLPAIGLRRLLVVAHREELLDQAAEKLRHWNPGLTVQVDQADRWADVDTLSAFDGELFAGTGYAVCASVATIGRQGSRRLTRYPAGLFDAVVIDEAHHSSAQSYQSVIDHFGAGKRGGPLLLGVTATPFRADGADLSKVYDRVVYSLELPDAITRGYLVDIRALAVATGVNLDAVGATREDFKVGDLAEAVNTPERNGRIVKAYLDHAADRKGIVFAADVQHSKDLVEAFLAVGVDARHVDGTTPGNERAAIFAWMREPGPRILCNVGVATEGYDEPSISVVLLARPTKSRVLYSQMIGRGTRLFAGKVDLLVIDLVDVSSKHTLVGAAALFGLPTGLDLAGTSASKAKKRVDELKQEGLPFEELSKAKTLAQLETIVNEYRRVGLFWTPKTAPEVAGLSALAWVSVGDGAIALRVGELRAWVTTDMLGHAHLAVRRRPAATPGAFQRPEMLEFAADFATLAEAVHEADVRLSADQPRVFIDPKARWRRDPASEKQLALLKKFRVPFREPLTKGEAGILLDKAFARRGAARRTA